MDVQWCLVTPARHTSDHDAAGIGRSMIHDAAVSGRFADHDAAGIGRWMIHHAAGIGRSMIHHGPGGSRPTPDEPPHGSSNLWAGATLWGVSGRCSGAWWHDVRVITPMMPPWWQNPINGPCRASQGWVSTHPSRDAHRSPPASRRAADRSPPASRRVADHRPSVHRPVVPHDRPQSTRAGTHHRRGPATAPSAPIGASRRGRGCGLCAGAAPNADSVS